MIEAAARAGFCRCRRTSNVQSISGNVSALVSLFAATIGSPIIRVAAFSYGVRSAIGQRQRGEVEKRVTAQMQADRAARKSAKRGRATGSVQS